MTLEAASSRHEGEDTASTLAQYLVHRLEEATEVEVDALPAPTQGLSNETVMCEASWRDPAGHHRRKLVLRLSPSGNQLFMDPHFAQQFALLSILGRETLVAVPEVLWFEEDDAVFGRPFFVMECIEGHVPTVIPNYNASGWLFDATPDQRQRAWSSAMRQLAAVHRVPVELLGFLAAPSDDPSSDGLTQDVLAARASLEWSTGGRPHEFLLALHDWLQDNLPDNRSTGLCWGDARIGNMVFGDDFEVAAVLDWEQASLGGSRIDLGWWLLFDELHSAEAGFARLDGLGSRRETIDLWEELTGTVAGDLDWYDVFTSYRLLQIACRARLLLNGPMRGSTSGEKWLVARAAERTSLPAPPGNLVSA
jgi:aminoglycoside phosphotransferase (APT) family kinase protein